MSETHFVIEYSDGSIETIRAEEWSPDGGKGISLLHDGEIVRFVPKEDLTPIGRILAISPKSVYDKYPPLVNK